MCFVLALKRFDADKVYVLGGLVDESIQKVFMLMYTLIDCMRRCILFLS